jgi:putative transposase
MPAPLSLDLRRRILDAVLSGSTTKAAVAERFAVHVATVERLLQRYRATGSVAPTVTTPGPARSLSEADDRSVAEIVEAECDLTLAEIAERFEGATGRSVHTKALERSLTRSGVTRKKKR